MTTANCPHCDEQVRVPAMVSSDATVKCPLCQEEYSLANALCLLPPELIVVDDMIPPQVDDVDAGTSWEELAEAEDEKTAASEFVFASAESPTTSPGFDFEGGASASIATPVRASARRHKPKGSPVKSIVSIVLGGLLAFPIAQLILWYLPGDLKRDFGAGPVVAQYVPAIVPAKFRGKGRARGDGDSGILESKSSEDAGGDTGEFAFDGNESSEYSGGPQFGGGPATSGTDQSDNNTQEATDSVNVEQSDPFGGAGQQDPFGSTEQQDPFGSTEQQDPFELPEMADSGGEPERAESPGIELPDIPIAPLTLSADDPVPVDPPKIDDDNEATTPTESEASPAGGGEVETVPVGTVKDAPAYTSVDVSDAFSKAVAASVDWDTESTASPKLRQSFYQAMSHLGEVLAYSDQQAEDIADQLRETRRLLTEVGKHPTKLQTIDMVEGKWVEAGNARRGTNGICIHGSVASIKQQGDLFEAVIQHEEWQVPVITRDEMFAELEEGKKVLLLGAILEDPGETLAGYQGDAEVVILNGLCAAIAEE